MEQDRIYLYLPKHVKKMIKQYAIDNDTNVNAFIVGLITVYFKSEREPIDINKIKTDKFVGGNK